MGGRKTGGRGSFVDANEHAKDNGNDDAENEAHENNDHTCDCNRTVHEGFLNAEISYEACEKGQNRRQETINETSKAVYRDPE